MKIPQDTPTPELDGRGGSYLASFNGLVVDSRYQIVDLIARGGMGSVYKALDTKLNRKVALKFIAADYVNDKTALRFQREARATSALDNNHIVRIYDFGTADNGSPYMVMEYARGKTLHQLLKKHGKLSLEDTLVIAENICLAMVHAHDRNIIHRDLKPGNIMVSRQDEELSAKVLDFGLSSIIEDNRQFLTGTGLVVGSPRYLSPEQARGEEADHRSDVYSLACAIYECLAGRGPFQAETSFALIKKHIEEDAPPMVKVLQKCDPQAFAELSDSSRDALEELARVLAICLKKDPDDRYQNMNELLLDIRTIRKTLQDAIDRDTTRTCSLFEEEDLSSTTTLDGIPAVLDNIAPASEKKARSWFIWVLAALGIATVGLAVTASVYLLGPSPVENTGSLTRETDILSIPNAQVHSDKSGATVGDFHGTVDTEAFKKSVKGDKLEIVGINLNDDQVAFVAERPLRRFCIRETVITSDQVKVLARSNSIKELIAKYSNIDDQGVAALTRMSQLRKLNLQGNEKLTGECLKAISANFPELYNLDVGHSGIKGKELVYLTGPRHLTNLDLQGLKLRDQDIKPLLKLHSLRAIDLTDNSDLTEKTLEQFGQATINNGTRYKINIKRCPGITAELAAKYQTKYPGLKIESTN